MAITSAFFGKTKKGEDVIKYTLTNNNGAYVSILDFGGTITEIVVPDSKGELADVCLGFDSMEGYNKGHGYMGEIIGRFGNRIKDGRFAIDGVEYQVPLNKNDGKVHLHGGWEGFDAKIWAVTTVEGDYSDSLVMKYLSVDGEEGYPGNLDVTVTYTWNDDNALSIRYQATTDKATVVNLTNHVYLNLAGHKSGNIFSHVVTIDADAITPNDPLCVPTGEYRAVVNTPFDLRCGMLMEDGLACRNDDPQMKLAGGYDHNYVLRKGCAMGTAGDVYEENSGRTVEVITDQPGMQFYTACTTNYKGGKDGADYGNFSGFCMETQHFPDSPNNPQWPTTTLRPGEVYDTTTIYAFGAEEQE